LNETKKMRASIDISRSIGPGLTANELSQTYCHMYESIVSRFAIFCISELFLYRQMHACIDSTRTESAMNRHRNTHIHHNFNTRESCKAHNNVINRPVPRHIFPKFQLGTERLVRLFQTYTAAHCSPIVNSTALIVLRARGNP
jgi:hypothetical protein